MEFEMESDENWADMLDVCNSVVVETTDEDMDTVTLSSSGSPAEMANASSETNNEPGISSRVITTPPHKSWHPIGRFKPGFAYRICSTAIDSLEGHNSYQVTK